MVEQHLIRSLPCIPVRRNIIRVKFGIRVKRHRKLEIRFRKRGVELGVGIGWNSVCVITGQAIIRRRIEKQRTDSVRRREVV